MRFKTEKELREEFNDVLEKLQKDGIAQQLKATFEEISESIKADIAKMRADGFTKEADDAERRRKEREQAFLKKQKDMEEEAFQKILQKYEEFKKSAVEINSFVDTSNKKMGEKIEETKKYFDDLEKSFPSD